MSEQEAYEAGLRQAREECQARVERIFKEIESYLIDCVPKGYSYPATNTVWWQALKRKEGV